MTAGAFGCCCCKCAHKTPFHARSTAHQRREREEMIPIYQLNRKPKRIYTGAVVIQFICQLTSSALSMLRIILYTWADSRTQHATFCSLCARPFYLPNDTSNTSPTQTLRETKNQNTRIKSLTQTHLVINYTSKLWNDLAALVYNTCMHYFKNKKNGMKNLQLLNLKSTSV